MERAVIAVDIAKRVFQLHWADPQTGCIEQLQLKRARFLEWFAKPAVPVVRYEREAPGELLHMDTKKLGRIVRPSHRESGDRRDSVDGTGWEFAHVAIR